MNYDGSLEFYFMNSLSALISETLVKDIFIRLDIRNFSEGYFHPCHQRLPAEALAKVGSH